MNKECKLKGPSMVPLSNMPEESVGITNDLGIAGC